jgi:hypothetical protein
MGRCVQHFDDPRGDTVALLANQLGNNTLAGNAAKHRGDFSVPPCSAFSG